MQKTSVGSSSPGRYENTALTLQAQNFDLETYAQKFLALDDSFSEFPKTKAQRVFHASHFSQLAQVFYH